MCLQKYLKYLVVRSADWTPGVKRLQEKGLPIQVVENDVSIFSDEFAAEAQGRIDVAKEHFRLALLNEQAPFKSVTAQAIAENMLDKSSLHFWLNDVGGASSSAVGAAAAGEAARSSKKRKGSSKKKQGSSKKKQGKRKVRKQPHPT